MALLAHGIQLHCQGDTLCISPKPARMLRDSPTYTARVRRHLSATITTEVWQKNTFSHLLWDFGLQILILCTSTYTIPHDSYYIYIIISDHICSSLSTRLIAA